MVLVAKDIVEKDFLSLKRDLTAFDAAGMMKLSNQGFAVILDEKGNPEGIVTEWDYLAKIIGEGRDAMKVTLGEIMSTRLVTVKAEDGLDRVAQVMSEQGVRRVLVMKDGKVIGVITARIMLKRLKEYVDKISSQIARLQAPRL
jgi:CBS domain-containing protein